MYASSLHSIALCPNSAQSQCLRLDLRANIFSLGDQSDMRMETDPKEHAWDLISPEEVNEDRTWYKSFHASSSASPMASLFLDGLLQLIHATNFPTVLTTVCESTSRASSLRLECGPTNAITAIVVLEHVFSIGLV
jgi:hypothetical protein